MRKCVSRVSRDMDSCNSCPTLHHGMVQRDECRTLFDHDPDKEKDATRRAAAVAQVFRRHKYPFDVATVEQLLCLVEQMQMQLPPEDKEASATPLENSLNVASAALYTDNSTPFAKFERLLRRWRGVQQLLSEHRKLQLVVQKLQEAQVEERWVLQQLREENDALKQLGLSGFVSAVQKMFLSPPCGCAADGVTASAMSLNDGEVYDHVSLVVLPDGVGRKEEEDEDEARRQRQMGAVNRLMPAQSRREVEYLMHVLQAVHLEAHRSRAESAAIQAKLNAMELRHQQEELQLQVRSREELNSLRAALQQERKEKMALLQELLDIRRLQAATVSRRPSVMMKQVEETEVPLRSNEMVAMMMGDDGNNDASSSERVHFHLKSPATSPLVATAAAGTLQDDVLSTSTVSGSTAPHESHLERLARETILPLSNNSSHSSSSNNINNNDDDGATTTTTTGAAAAVGGGGGAPPLLRGGVFTAPPAVTFSRPSASSLEMARQVCGLGCGSNDVNRKKKGTPFSSRNRSGTCLRMRNERVGNSNNNSNDNSDEHALYLLRRLVPDGGATIFEVSVALYEGVQKLAARWRRATDEAYRHGKRLHELEAIAATTLRLQEEAQRQQKLLSLLHCRAEEKEEAVRRLKGRLADTRAGAAKLKQKLAEYELRGEQQQEETAKEEGRCSAPPRNDSSGNGHAARRQADKSVSNGRLGVNKKTKRSGSSALERERARAEDAEKALRQVQDQLSAANDELLQGKRFLQSLLRDGQDELRARVQEQTVRYQEEDVTEAVEDPLVMDSPEPIPPSPQTSSQGARHAAVEEQRSVANEGRMNAVTVFGVERPREEGLVQESIPVAHPDEWSGADSNGASSMRVSRKNKKRQNHAWGMEIVTDDSLGPWGALVTEHAACDRAARAPPLP